MVKRNFAELAICEINEEMDRIPVKNLHNLYLEKTSEIIYIIKNKKLYGIVCMGEILSAHKKNIDAKINKSGRVLTGYDIVKAQEIFRNYRKINQIPVVNEHNELIGDYLRWDDMLYIERNWKRVMQEEPVREFLNPFSAVYVVQPANSDQPIYLKLIECLKQYDINFDIIDKMVIPEKLTENAVCIFLNEDEKRGTLCLHGIEPCFYDSTKYNISKYDKLADERWNIRLTTYKTLLFHMQEKKKLQQVEIEKPESLIYEKLDIKGTVLLSALEKRGIKCYALHCFEDEVTEYGANFLREMNLRLEAMQEYTGIPFSNRLDREAFYGDLLQIEDYRNGTAQRELSFGENAFEYKKNITGKYFNARNGRRVTCFQPKEYIGTIYVLGMCTIIGAYVEDKHTITSILQKMLIEKGYMYRVENCGSMIREDCEIDDILSAIKPYHPNDIVIYLSAAGTRTSITYGSLEKIFEKYQVPNEWVESGYTHCNYEAGKLIAMSMMEIIEPGLVVENKNYNDEIQINIHDIMGEYVQKRYREQYFSDFFAEKYKTIGAVVMKSGPFHLGHRYLIEQAKQQVDFLIVFVIEGDVSIFPFEERFKMTVEGTKDLDNIMVVPSGDFVLSRNNFNQYYRQSYDMTTGINASYDIDVFINYIAKSLHITHRFAGANAQGRVNKTYYETMKRKLPAGGISFVEIPRLTAGGEVSTKQILKNIEEQQYDKAFALVPESTKQYLLNQIS